MLGEMSEKELKKLIDRLDEDIKMAFWRGSATMEVACKALLNYHLEKIAEVDGHGWRFNYCDYADYGDGVTLAEASAVAEPETDVTETVVTESDVATDTAVTDTAVTKTGVTETVPVETFIAAQPGWSMCWERDGAIVKTPIVAWRARYIEYSNGGTQDILIPILVSGRTNAEIDGPCGDDLVMCRPDGRFVTQGGKLLRDQAAALKHFKSQNDL
jgi:hypothetical protein